MKILVIHGSPRKEGNSSFLSNSLAERLHGDVTHRRLYDLDFKGCLGCMSCRKKTEECVMKDELTPVLAEIRQADVTLFASPIYHGGMSGELKCLVDRCFSFFATDHFAKVKAGVHPIPTRLAAGKTAVPVFTQGRDASAWDYVLPQFEARLALLGFTHVEPLRGCLLNSAKDSRNRPDLLDQAAAMAERINARYAG